MGERFWESVQTPSSAKEMGSRNFEHAQHSNNFYELGLKNYRASAEERKTIEWDERKAELESLLDSDMDGLFTDLDPEKPSSEAVNG